MWTDEPEHRSSTHRVSNYRVGVVVSAWRATGGALGEAPLTIMPALQTLIILSAAALGGVGGVVSRALLLAQLHRRTDHERARPVRHTWWVPVVAALAAGLVSWRFGADQWPWLLAFLPLSILGAHLAVIDLDVHRLPNRELSVLATLTVPGTIAACLLTGTSWNLLVGAASAVVLLGVFLLLDRIQPGGMGGGDIKFAGLIAFSLGSLDAMLPWLALITSCLIAALHAAMRRQQRLPFGPALYLGAIGLLPFVAL